MSSNRIIALVAVLAVMAIFAVVVMRGRAQKGLGGRLLQHSRDRTDYLMYVGMPREAPASWVGVAAIDDSGVTLDDGRRLKLGEVTAYFVAYPSKNLVDYESPTGLSVPAWVNGLRPDPVGDSSNLTLDDLNEGNALIRVTYGKSTAHPSSPIYYSTTLTNFSNKRVRVLKFGGYFPQGRTFVMRNAAGRFYTTDEFMEWYGQKGRWIEPGQSVTDPNNYGSRPMLWAYYVEVEGGQRCWAGEVNY